MANNCVIVIFAILKSALVSSQAEFGQESQLGQPSGPFYGMSPEGMGGPMGTSEYSLGLNGNSQPRPYAGSGPMDPSMGMNGGPMSQSGGHMSGSEFSQGRPHGGIGMDPSMGMNGGLMGQSGGPMSGSEFSQGRSHGPIAMDPSMGMNGSPMAQSEYSPSRPHGQIAMDPSMGGLMAGSEYSHARPYSSMAMDPSIGLADPLAITGQSLASPYSHLPAEYAYQTIPKSAYDAAAVASPTYLDAMDPSIMYGSAPSRGGNRMPSFRRKPTAMDWESRPGSRHEDEIQVTQLASAKSLNFPMNEYEGVMPNPVLQVSKIRYHQPPFDYRPIVNNPFHYNFAFAQKMQHHDHARVWDPLMFATRPGERPHMPRYPMEATIDQGFQENGPMGYAGGRMNNMMNSDAPFRMNGDMSIRMNGDASFRGQLYSSGGQQEDFGSQMGPFLWLLRRL